MVLVDVGLGVSHTYFSSLKSYLTHSFITFWVGLTTDETRPRGRRFHTVSCQK